MWTLDMEFGVNTINCTLSLIKSVLEWNIATVFLVRLQRFITAQVQHKKYNVRLFTLRPPEPSTNFPTIDSPQLEHCKGEKKNFEGEKEKTCVWGCADLGTKQSEKVLFAIVTSYTTNTSAATRRRAHTHTHTHIPSCSKKTSSGNSRKHWTHTKH